MRLYFLVFLLSAWMIPSGAGAQSGCTDLLAQNFDASALINDGSCIYTPASLPLLPLTTLPATLEEISGLAFDGEKWWAQNDGGGDPVFYRIQPVNGQILQTVRLDSAANKDWEEISFYQNNLLIGDFGNNSNNRQDLGIYSIPLDDIGSGNEIIVPDSTWHFIPFAFPDQTDFTSVPLTSATHDCEAMIWRNGKIHLFTKNWKAYQTSHYTLDPATGITTLLESFDTKGVVTGAAISPDSQLVVLLCYDIKDQYSAFAWLLWDWPDPGSDLLFTGNKRRVDFGSLVFNGQVEGITFNNNRNGYISNESSFSLGTVLKMQALKSFDFSEWVPDAALSGSPEISAENTWQVAPTLFSDHISVNAETSANGRITIYNLNGNVVFSTAFTGSATIETHRWPPGMYVMNCSSEAGCFAAKLFKIK